MKLLIFAISFTTAAANAQSIQCNGTDGTTVSVTPGIILSKPGQTGPGDTHTAVIKRKDGKTNTYSVHARSEASSLVVLSYLGFDDVRFKLKIENYIPNTTAADASLKTLKRILVDVKDPETGELKWTASQRVKEEDSLNCNISGSFSIKNSCTGKSKDQLNQQLLQAARTANLELSEQALACGADINFQDKNGCTPLISAVENENALCRKEKYPALDPIFSARVNLLAETFMDQGAYYDSKDKNGRTALHRAVSNPILWTEEVLNLLISLEADLNIQDENDLSPLMLAAQLGLEYSVYALAKAGADTSLKDKKGRTAYDLGEKLYPKWIRDMLSGISKEIVITGSNSTCSPLSIEIPTGERVRLKFSATDSMYVLSVPGLSVNLMANPNETVEQVIQTESAGTFAFECGSHGGTQSKGEIIAK